MVNDPKRSNMWSPRNRGVPSTIVSALNSQMQFDGADTVLSTVRSGNNHHHEVSDFMGSKDPINVSLVHNDAQVMISKK